MRASNLWFGLVVGIAFCVGWKAAPATFDAMKVGDLEAKSIVLKAADGSKITLSVSDGTAGIWIENGKSKNLVSIYTTEGQSAVGIWESPGKGSGYDIAMGLVGTEGPVLQVIDRGNGTEKIGSLTAKMIGTSDRKVIWEGDRGRKVQR